MEYLLPVQLKWHSQWQVPAVQAEAEAGGGLIVKLDKSRAGAAGDPQALAAQWFSQPLFAGLNLEVAAASGELHQFDLPFGVHQPSGNQLLQLQVRPATSGGLACWHALRPCLAQLELAQQGQSSCI